MVGIGQTIRPSLLARDLSETRAFYVDRLGFRATGFYPDEKTAHWIELSRDGVVLYFFDDPPAGTSGDPVMSGTLYLYPDSVDALAEELSGKVEFAWGPETMDYGMREFAVRDPNGYYVAFTEPA